jgi:hypothetical protein
MSMSADSLKERGSARGGSHRLTKWSIGAPPSVSFLRERTVTFPFACVQDFKPHQEKVI